MSISNYRYSPPSNENEHHHFTRQFIFQAVTGKMSKYILIIPRLKSFDKLNNEIGGISCQIERNIPSDNAFTKVDLNNFIAGGMYEFEESIKGRPENSDMYRAALIEVKKFEITDCDSYEKDALIFLKKINGL